MLEERYEGKLCRMRNILVRMRESLSCNLSSGISSVVDLAALRIYGFSFVANSATAPDV
jgi:hypothetical protein